MSDRTRYILKSAKCPYYVMSARLKIHCDISGKGIHLHMIFPNKDRQTRWQNHFCCCDWEHCPLTGTKINDDMI